MTRGFGYLVVKTDASVERYESFREIAERYCMTVQTVSYWFYHRKVSRMGIDVGILEIRRP